MKYKPLTDEQLEKESQQRIDDCINQVRDLNFPKDLTLILEEEIEGYDWGEVIIEEDKDKFQEMLSDIEVERNYGEEGC